MAVHIYKFLSACLVAWIVLFQACQGRGDLSFPSSETGNHPVDSAADTPRPVTDFLFNELTDLTEDIPRTLDNFNFKTVIDTEISIQLRLYDGLTPSSVSPQAVVLLRDGAERLLWAGVTDAAGYIHGAVSLPAAVGTASLYIYKDRFGERTVTITDLAKIKKLDRSLYVQKAAGLPFVAAAKLQFAPSPAFDISGPALSLVDSDADAVPDAFDDFPLDPARAFKIRVPAEQYFTISFEDLFPVVGDGDYNDFTGRYGLTQVLNSQNKIVEILGDADAIARLAGYAHRFGLVIRFPGVSATLDTHRAGATCNGISSASQNVTGLANIVFFERTDQAFTGPTGHHSFFTLHFNTPVNPDGIDLPPYDPYVYVHNTGKDVHLIGKPQLPGSQNPAQPVGFRDANGFPWAILVPSSYKYPKEGMFIENAYPQFAAWRQSLGQTNQDWYNFPVANNVIAQQPVISCNAALQVQTTIPADNEALLPVNTVVRIFFNQSIDATTVNYQTVKVMQGNAALSGTLHVSANELQFIPTYDLTPGTQYSIRASGSIKSVTGDPLQNEFVSNFSTEVSASASEIRELDIYTEGSGAVFTPFGGDIYFGAAQTYFGTELWKSDGTYHGTTQVRDIFAGDSSSAPEAITALGNRLLFSAAHPVYGRELFFSDGSMFGTDLVFDHAQGISGGSPSGFKAAGPWLFYVVDDGTHGRELWKSDGSSAAIVRDINQVSTGAGLTAGSVPSELTVLNDKLVFVADDGAHGRELWLSDGSDAGTTILKDLRTGIASSTPQSLTVSSGKIYFSAYDAVFGNELFETDGTASGTQLKSDIYAGGSSSFPTRLIDVQGKLFFVATGEGTGGELYCLAGGNPKLTKDITLGSLSTYFGEMVAFNDVLLFVRTGVAGGDEIWRSDCTESGTYMIRKLNPGNIQYMTSYLNRIYFSANDGLNGQELWKTDGTFAGTLMVRNIKAGVASSNPANLTASGNRLYFRISDPFSAFPEALWKYEP